jgi:hypothetical protein
MQEPLRDEALHLVDELRSAPPSRAELLRARA